MCDVMGVTPAEFGGLLYWANQQGLEGKTLDQARAEAVRRTIQNSQASLSRLDFCRKGRIAMWVGRLTCSPAGALRARPAIYGAWGRASVKSGAANQRSLNMSTPSIANSRNLKTAASKKRSVKSSAPARRQVTSAATTAKAPPKSDEPKVERVTKQERLLTLLSQAEEASIEEMM